MNLNVKNKFVKNIDSSIKSMDSQKNLQHDARMIMYRFLSEIERISDEKDLNRKELASLIGTSASYITQLFRGNKMINLETIAKFQEVFDIAFEIKAIPNRVSDSFLSMNVDTLYENQKNNQGFWAFHKFSPRYGEQEGQTKIQKQPEEKRIA